MDHSFELLKKNISNYQPIFGDGDSVLTFLYEAYSECNRMDDSQTKADCEELYRRIRGMPLKEIGKIIYLP